MPQNPIPAQAFARKPDLSFAQIMANAQGVIYSVSPYNFGNNWYVDETSGNDTNDGSAGKPFKTLDAAQDAATANNGDAVYFYGTVHISETLAWSKNGVSLIGLNAPSDNSRARISQTGSSVFTPLVKVTAEGSEFQNFATFHGFNDASAQICWEEASGRNYYSKVQFLGMGNTTAAAQAGSRSLLLSGADGESVFDDCTIGLSTVARATGNNASLEFTNFSARNIFNRPVFQALVTNAPDCHIIVGASGMIDYALFNNPVFLNMVDHGATAMDAAVKANAGAGGSIVLNNPVSLGATALATTGPVYVVGVVPVAATSGIAINAT